MTSFTQTLSFSCNNDDVALLDAVARQLHRTPTESLRWLILRAADELDLIGETLGKSHSMATNSDIQLTSDMQSQVGQFY